MNDGFHTLGLAEHAAREEAQAALPIDKRNTKWLEVVLLGFMALVFGLGAIAAGVAVFYYFGSFLEEQGVNKVASVVIALIAGVLTWYAITQWLVPAFVPDVTPA